MSPIVVDSHVLHWWSAEPRRLSRRAVRAIEEADEVVVSAISWYELAWLGHHGRIAVSIPVRSWLEQLAADVRTLAITPAIADTATTLPATFPGDPADRLIFASAVEHGLRLVTKDERLRRHRHPSPIVVW